MDVLGMSVLDAAAAVQDDIDEATEGVIAIAVNHRPENLLESRIRLNNLVLVS